MSDYFNFFSHPYTSDIANGVYILDQYIRQDFCDGCVVSEPDYVSTLMGYIRLFLRSSQLAKKIYSFENQKSYLDHFNCHVLNKTLEQNFGCDALIIFRANNKAKVCMFEAKSPRLNSNRSWDKLQDSNNISHFHDQLTRQKNWSKTAAIWELFINDSPPGVSLKGFDKYGSTCIWHHEAYAYSINNIKSHHYDMNSGKASFWTNYHLKNCINELTSNSLNLEDILNSILFGKTGKEIEVKDNSILLKPEEGKTIRIPVIIDEIKELCPQILEDTGVKHFLFIELENISFDRTEIRER